MIKRVMTAVILTAAVAATAGCQSTKQALMTPFTDGTDTATQYTKRTLEGGANGNANEINVVAFETSEKELAQWCEINQAFFVDKLFALYEKHHTITQIANRLC